MPPEYVFEKPDGTHVDIFMSADEAPRCGDTIVLDGQELTRVPVAPQLHNAKVAWNGAFKSYSLPRRHAAKAMGMPLAPNYDKDGFAVFPNVKSATELQAKSADTPHPVVYDR